MKKLIYIALTVSVAFFYGCVSDFLDRPAHNMTPEVDLNDPVRLNSSLYTAILNMNEGQGDALSSMGEIASDNALRGSILSDGGGTDPGRQFNQFQNFYGITPASMNFIEALWTGLYPGINQANINLRALDRLFPDIDPAMMVALRAENRFMRAWFYMFLVNTFGQVVVVPEGDITPREYAELTNDKTVCQLYDYIIGDLRSAAADLPAKSGWEDLGVVWQGRAHNGSAQGYLAKALLYQAANLVYYNADGGAAKAADCYAEIVKIVSDLEGQYSLADDYEMIWREAGNYNSESMFEVGSKSTADGTTRFAGWRPTQPRGYQGYGRLAPSLNLINQYERDGGGVIIDKRYRGTVLFGETTPLSGMTSPAVGDFMRTVNGDNINGITFSNSTLGAGWPNRYCRKSVQPHPASTATSPVTNLGGANLKFLRWGEVLLIGAEAACYTHDEVSARRWLKMVRSRAGLDASPINVDALTGQALIDQIWKDKRLEIALEWSNRYYEMVRIDKIHPGYMRACFSAKIDDELAGIKAQLDATNQWGIISSAQFPITPDNYTSALPLRNGLQIPRHYTMPISTRVFATMPNIKQTQYYR